MFGRGVGDGGLPSRGGLVDEVHPTQTMNLLRIAQTRGGEGEVGERRCKEPRAEFGRGLGCRTGGLCRWGRARGLPRLGHQAIGPELCPRSRRGFYQKIEVEGIIAILEECTLPAVALLCDMMRDAGNNDAGQTRHGNRIMASGYLVKCHRNQVIRGWPRAARQPSRQPGWFRWDEARRAREPWCRRGSNWGHRKHWTRFQRPCCRLKCQSWMAGLR